MYTQDSPTLKPAISPKPKIDKDNWLVGDSNGTTTNVRSHSIPMLVGDSNGAKANVRSHSIPTPSSFSNLPSVDISFSSSSCSSAANASKHATSPSLGNNRSGPVRPDALPPPPPPPPNTAAKNQLLDDDAKDLASSSNNEASVESSSDATVGNSSHERLSDEKDSVCQSVCGVVSKLSF